MCCIFKNHASLKIYASPPREACLLRLRTTKLNHLLTMFTQKFYEATIGFQFYFAREVVYGEESSKSSSPHQREFLRKTRKLVFGNRIVSWRNFFCSEEFDSLTDTVWTASRIALFAKPFN